MSKLFKISRKFKLTEEEAKLIYSSNIFSTVKTVKITSYLFFKTKKTAYLLEVYSGRGTFLRIKNFYKTDEGRTDIDKFYRLRGPIRTMVHGLAKKLNKAQPLKFPRMVIEKQSIQLAEKYKHIFMALEVVPPENGNHFAGYYFEVERRNKQLENCTLEKLMGNAYQFCKFLQGKAPLNISFLAERINSLQNGGEACLANDLEDVEAPKPLKSKEITPITLSGTQDIDSFLGSLTNKKEPPSSEESLGS